MEKEYEVIVPFAGAISMIVKAESEGAAKDKAMCASFGLEIIDKEDDSIEMHEWDTYRETGRGNVTYLSHNEIEVMEL